MKLNEFYEKALSTLSLSVDDDGYVVIKDEESTSRVTVGKKFLVMATSNHVSTMDDNKLGWILHHGPKSDLDDF